MEDLKNIKDMEILKAICIENFGGILTGSAGTIKTKIIENIAQ